MDKANIERIHHRGAAAERSARLKAAVGVNPAFGPEISHLELLDNAGLWKAAQTRLPQSDAERMEELHRRQRLTGLSDTEAQELSRFEQQYEFVILVRSHSAMLLEQRGHDIRKLTTRGDSRGSAPGEFRSLTPGG
ncbi:MAG TPA: hypothetical protein VE078_19245 [Thermoanaerobaculia bacterium]|nr:hypothetical protein [Thermoanaerobaculia bacterium]